MIKHILSSSTSSYFSTVFLIIILLSSCARNPVTGKREFMLVSKGQEIEMGKQADPEIIAFFGLYEDPKLQRFINDKGNEMARESHQPDLDYQFKIVDSPVVNAFAVPGGYVYFTRGIMAHFNNEAEFAGVLGHEIGHITARHSAKQQSRAVMAELGLIVGSVISETFAQFADIGRTGLGILFLKYGRDAERESDKLGVEYSTKIGYDAHQMANFFNTIGRIQNQSGETVPDFLSTHPNPGDRYKRVGELADNWKNELNASNLKVNRNEYLRLIDGLVYGEDPRQGYVVNSVFYHPELKFSFPIPQNWIVQNTPQQVQMAPSDGQSLLLLTLSPDKDLETAGNALLENYQFTLVGSEKITVNGFNALTFVADQVQQNQTLRILVYLIQDNELIYTFMGLSLEQTFNNYLPVFTSTMSNFKRLTDPSKINVKPDRIKIIEVTKSTTLSGALQEAGMPAQRFEELAILNGMDIQQTLSPGMLIKVIGK